MYKGWEAKDRHEVQGGYASDILLKSWYGDNNDNASRDPRAGDRFYDPLEGNDDGANYGAEYGGEKGFREKGIPILLSTVGIIFSGGGLLLAEGALATTYAGVGLGFSLDDLSGEVRGSNTFLESLAHQLGGEKGVDLLKGAKLAFNVKDAGKGIVNITTILADGKQYTGAYDLINDIWSVSMGIEEVVNKASESNSLSSDNPNVVSGANKW